MRGSESISCAPMPPRKLKPEPGQRSLAGATPRAPAPGPSWPPSPEDLSPRPMCLHVDPSPSSLSFAVFGFAGADPKPEPKPEAPPAVANDAPAAVPARGGGAGATGFSTASGTDWKPRGGFTSASQAMAGASKAGGGSSLFTSASSMMVNPDTVDLTTDDANEDESPGKRRKTSPEERKETKRYDPVEYREKQRIKREKDERTKKKRRECRQTSIFDAMAGANAPNLRGSADPIPKEVWQRILAHAPVSSLRDMRLVSKTMRNAVDDEGFLPFTKIAQQTRRMRTIDADRVISESSSGRRKLPPTQLAEAVAAGSGPRFGHASPRQDLPPDRPARDDEDHAAGIIQRIARDKPFATPMSASALAREVEIGVERAEARDERTPVPGHVPGEGLAATVRELARWKIVGSHGWALLAAAILVAAEDYGTIALLLDAAHRACVRTGREPDADDGGERRHHAGDYCAREDLTEFISLLAMALRVPSRWTRGAVDEYDEALVEPSASRLAHLDAAAGYLELIPHREAAGDVGADRGFTSRLTHEQLSIVSADVKKDEVLLVRAFAGTGKTTTLLEYVKRRPGYQFAYITFNRSVMEEASTKFPKLNVKCLNFHKMAYAKFGFLYRGEKFLRGTLRQYHVSKAIGVNDSRALFAIRVLNEFLKSADLAVELKHAEAIRFEVSTKDWNKVYDKSNVKEKLGSQSPEENLVELVKKLWDKMLNPEDSSFPMTDAGYLKRYQLACRREHNPVRLDVNFDILMLDEAQDAAPVMADIILSQNECGKILVGDPHQEIYSFMGAKNAMATVAATVDKSKIVERRLTRSFRFGYEIADVANTLLRLKGETTCLIGSRRDLPDPVWSSWSDQEEVSAVHCLPRPKDADGVTLTLQSYAPGYTATLCTRLGDRPIREQGRQLVVLCRSNASVFDVASRILNLGIKDLKLGFVGGLEGQRLGQLMDIWRLARQSDDELDAITDYFVSRFVKEYLKALENGVKDPEPPFQALKSSAKLSNDLEMQTKISIVEKYRGNLPELIEKLKKVDVGTNPSDLKCANYLLSTAHRAKGLEFDHVLLWNDFLAVNQCSPIEWDSNGHATLFAIAVGNMLDESEVVGADDLNLVYVAATRAKQRLIVSDALKHLITAPRCRFAATWYLRRDTNLPTTEMIAEDLAPYEVLAQRRGGPAHFATLRCATNTCDRCGDQSDVFGLPEGSVQADKVDNAPTLGMEVRYGRIRQGMADTDTRFAKGDPHAVSTVPMIAPSESYAFRHNRRMCGRCVRTFAVSRRGADRYLDDDTAGYGVEHGCPERPWVDDTILEDFALENNLVNNIDPIEGMSMMDIASVCAAERRARGEPWRGKDAAGEPRQTWWRTGEPIF